MAKDGNYRKTLYLFDGEEIKDEIKEYKDVHFYTAESVTSVLDDIEKKISDISSSIDLSSNLEEIKGELEDLATKLY